MIARRKALEVYFNQIESQTIQSFLNSGGRIVTKSVQRGKALSTKGKQEVADSLVVISFREEGDNEADNSRKSKTHHCFLPTFLLCFQSYLFCLFVNNWSIGFHIV